MNLNPLPLFPSGHGNFFGCPCPHAPDPSPALGRSVADAEEWSLWRKGGEPGWLTRSRLFLLKKNQKPWKTQNTRYNICMGDSMSRVEIYNEDYIGLNHAYVQMYKFYNKLLDASDADEEVLSVMREILLVFNPTLDRIKSEMTVKTRYKEESDGLKSANTTVNENTDKSEDSSDKGVIFHGNFTGE